VISAVVLARDEALHLPDCLATLHWVDELLVLDSGSTDKTVEVALSKGARVEHRPFTHFGEQRQAALDLAKCEWVLFVDADERVPPALAAEVAATVRQHGPEVGWWIRRRNFFWGREVRHSGWAPDYQLRLLKRARASYAPDQMVHEVAQLAGPEGYLQEPLLHINYDSWHEFWSKQGTYARYEALKLAAQGQRWKPWNIFLQPARAFRRRWLEWEGWKDGLLGLQLALAMAWWEGVTYLELQRLSAATSVPERSSHNSRRGDGKRH
jgi:(heptosyl)LPS beta-1,4-glucosyltransferase